MDTVKETQIFVEKFPCPVCGQEVTVKQAVPQTGYGYPITVTVAAECGHNNCAGMSWDPDHFDQPLIEVIETWFHTS